MPGAQSSGDSVDSLKECSSSKTAHSMIGQLEQMTLNSSYRTTLKIITPEKQVKPPKATVDATWNQFLKKLQLASSAFLRYHSLPQQSVSNRMNLNSPATKSATLAASVPSLPLMPIPTSAAVIIFTSLAPSPTANVKAEDLSLKISTISFLLAGVQRQQMVWSVGSIFGIIFSALSRNTFFSLISFSFLICNCHPCSSPSVQAGMSTNRASLSISPQERPILIAVSRLSPVRMKKVMPARRISVMVWMTSSCSSSSMAVAPTSSRSFQMLSQHLAMASSFLPPIMLFTLTYSQFQDLYSSSLRCFFPSMSVLRPFTLRLSMCYCVAAISFLLVSARISSFTVESAPFVQSMIFLDCASRMITDMRFRTELNSRKASFSYFMMLRRAPLPSAISIMRLCSPSSSFSCSLAKLMRAISSGELELQVSLPSFSSTQMSWQRQINFNASCTFWLLFMPRSLASYILTLPRISAGVFLNSASSTSSPQSVPSQTKQRKSMLFLVRVPVLSVKTYLIWPRFSLTEVLLAEVQHLQRGEKPWGSELRVTPWNSLTISMVTMSEMGMKQVMSSHQVQVVIQKLLMGMNCVISWQLFSSSVLNKEQTSDTITWQMKISTTSLFISVISFDFFGQNFTEFSTNLVSEPVYRQIPITQCTFLRVQPRKIRLLWSIFTFPSKSAHPQKLAKYLFGGLYSISKERLQVSSLMT